MPVCAQKQGRDVSSSEKKTLSTKSLTIHTNNTHRHWNAELLFKREQRFRWEKNKKNPQALEGWDPLGEKRYLSLFVTVLCNMIAVK